MAALVYLVRSARCIDDGDDGNVLNLPVGRFGAGLPLAAAHDQVVAVIPSRVVAHILLNDAVRPLEFLWLVEKIETLDEPLAIAPHMIVLGVELQHRVDKLGLSVWRAELIDDGMSMVPYLVILEVFQRGGIQPCDFVFE